MMWAAPLDAPLTRMHDPLHAAFDLAAAVDCGEAQATRNAAAAVETELGTGSTRELLRMLHLFFGFPKIVQALNASLDVLPVLDDEDCDKDLRPNPARPDPLAQGEHNFRELYAEDADRVLDHLAILDPILRAWILDHAYARALLRGGLSLAQTERLAVLCLAATGCWKQWESHVAIAIRAGVTPTILLADCLAAQAWVGKATSTQARARLTGIAS